MRIFKSALRPYGSRPEGTSREFYCAQMIDPQCTNDCPCTNECLTGKQSFVQSAFPSRRIICAQKVQNSHLRILLSSLSDGERCHGFTQSDVDDLPALPAIDKICGDAVTALLLDGMDRSGDLDAFAGSGVLTHSIGPCRIPVRIERWHQGTSMHQSTSMAT